MGWRSVMIEHPAHLSTKQGQLLILTDQEYSLPLEDLNILLLESRQSQLTTAALAAMAEAGVALMVCDRQHLPCGVLLPYSQHSRPLAVAKLQLNASQPRKNRLWQQVIRAKISNQARCLRLQGLNEGANKLDSYAGSVSSGDKGNAEAIAAAFYFRALFGNDFRRGDEHGINAALNYGYALIRGLVARTLCTYGFLSCFGLHHCNELNPFNLTDDIMEPFRPLVDLYVVQNISTDLILTSREKQALFSLLSMSILSGGQHHAISGAVERCVQSLVRALQLKGQPALMLPELLPLRQHSYE